MIICGLPLLPSPPKAEAAHIVIISETDEAASWKSVRRADNV